MSDPDMGWLAEQRRAMERRARQDHEVHEKYRGKWVARVDGAVIASGETVMEAIRAADAACAGREYVLEAVDYETDVIYGGA